MTAVTSPIAEGWSWKQRDASVASVLGELASTWTSADRIPSEIHVELLKTGRIPDPFLGFNEHEVQCEYRPISSLLWLHLQLVGVGETEWLYTTKFDVPMEETNWKHAELLFEGLDTLCDVYLVCPNQVRHPASLPTSSS